MLFVWSLALGLLSSFFSFSLPGLSRNLPETRGGERQEPPQQREQRRGGAAGPLRGAGFGGKELEDADSSPETRQAREVEQMAVVPLIMGKVCENPTSPLDNLCVFSWLEEVIFHFPARERKLQ